MAKSMYEQLGVDPHKQNVRDIFERVVDNEYPGAFVNIITDPNCYDRVMTQHQDGDGSKFVQRMLHYMKTSDPSVFNGMLDDALSMNTGDIAACGFVDGTYLITDVLNLNLPKQIKEIVMRAIGLRMSELKELYLEHGIIIKFLGGETADLRDQVRSGVFDLTVTAWTDRENVIRGNVQDGDLIFGIPSDGQAVWELEPNSGLMSNGLTLGRSSLMSKDYNFIYPLLKRDDIYYKGRYEYNNRPKILGGMTVSEALLSPTRQWALVIKELISSLREMRVIHMLHGISMNTGGGATKIKNIGKGGIIYTKMMPPPPPICKLIKSESRETWENMYTSFNCGIGIDIIGENNPVFINAVEAIKNKCGLPVIHLGSCIYSNNPDAKNSVELITPYGHFKYE